MRIPRLLTFVCLLVSTVSMAWGQLPASVVSADGSSATSPHLKVSLVSSAATIAPGAGFQTGIHFELDKGWHVYWLNAGDVGYPPTVKWTLPVGITAGPLQFPAPQRILYAGLLDYGYPDEVLFPVDMEVAPGLKTGAPAVLSARVDWLVCKQSCIPGKATLTTSVKTGATPTAAAAVPPSLAPVSGKDYSQEQDPEPGTRSSMLTVVADQASNHLSGFKLCSVILSVVFAPCLDATALNLFRSCDSALLLS